MARERVLKVTILGDAKDAQKAFGQLEKTTSGFGDKFLSIGKKMATFGAVAAGVGAVVGKELFETGSKLEAMGKKASTVFGDQLGTVQKWADANAKAMGLTRSAATGLAANFADLLVPMGFARDEAAKMSTNVVGLSGALSEWSGGTRSAAEVSEILAKAMLGERDGLKELGISISEADVSQRLLTKGQKDLTGTALEQAKAIATQELIMEKSTDAQAAFAAGGSKALRSQAQLTAGLNEAKETMARAFLPIATKIVTWASENLPQAFERGRAFVTNLIDKWKEGGGSFEGTTGKVRELLTKLSDTFRDVVALVTEMWRRWGDDLMRYAQTSFDNIVRVVGGLLDILSGIVNTVMGVLTGDWSRAWEGIKAVFSGVWDAVVGTIAQQLNIINTLTGGALARFADTWRAAWEGTRNFFAGIWEGIKRVVGEGVHAVAGVFLWLAGTIIDGAANAFGWVKGLGPQLREAQGKFHAFAAETNRALANINKDVKVRVSAEVIAAFKADTGNVLAGRQHGGPVFAGRPYVVGEVRPELFVPEVDGRIVPRVGSRPGGGNVYVTVNVPNYVGDKRELADTVRREFERAARSGTHFAF